MKTLEYKQVDGKMKLVARQMTKEEMAITSSIKTEPEEDALHEMITAISTANSLSDMRCAAKSFLIKTQ